MKRSKLLLTLPAILSMGLVGCDASGSNAAEPAHEHNYVAQFTPATLDSPSETKYVCECGEVEKVEHGAWCPKTVVEQFCKDVFGSTAPVVGEDYDLYEDVYSTGANFGTSYTKEQILSILMGYYVPAQLVQDGDPELELDRFWSVYYTYEDNIVVNYYSYDYYTTEYAATEDTAVDASKTYYVSINGATLSATLNIRMYNKNYEYIGYGTLIGSGSNFNITKTTAVVDDTPKYFKFRTAVANVPSVDAKIMISTLSDLIYEPYKGNTYPISLGSIELCKIGDYQDYIYKENDKWYKYGAIGKVVLDGTEANWSTRGGATTYAYSCPSIFDGNKASGLCSHWNFISGGATNSQANECVATANTNTSIAIFTNNSSLDTLANLKTWLGNNTPTIYYVLATPTTTQITDATLISQLEALKGAESYKEQTNISQVNNDEAFIISASALKDLSNL